jgi:uncharacterized caspase-like protein
MRLRIVRLIVLCLAACTLVLPAHASRRIALLIGNQSYHSDIGRLANPHNDVDVLARALSGIGFEVTVVRDAGLPALHQSINAHIRRLRGAGDDAVGLFYYSGHGAQDAGSGLNYLIPVDVGSAEDTTLWDQSIRLTEITRRLKSEAGQAAHFVVIDACRNALRLKSTGTRALVQSKGFVPQREEAGMLIAYATAEGELASDVGEGSGPYARVLAEEIVKPGIEAVTMFRRVQLRVRASIRQEPWLGFGALGEVHLAGLGPPQPTAPSGPTLEQQVELELWATVKDSTDPTLLQSFLDRYPRGAFAPAARLIIERLNAETERNAQAAILAEQLRRAEEAQRAAEIERRERDRQAELAKQTEELRRTQDEARKAQEALRKAEQEREVAKRAADDANAAAAKAKSEREAAAKASSAGAPSAAAPRSKSSGSNCFTFNERTFCQ